MCPRPRPRGLGDDPLLPPPGSHGWGPRGSSWTSSLVPLKGRGPTPRGQGRPRATPWPGRGFVCSGPLPGRVERRGRAGGGRGDAVGGGPRAPTLESDTRGKREDWLGRAGPFPETPPLVRLGSGSGARGGPVSGGEGSGERKSRPSLPRAVGVRHPLHVNRGAPPSAAARLLPPPRR